MFELPQALAKGDVRTEKTLVKKFWSNELTRMQEYDARDAERKEELERILEKNAGQEVFNEQQKAEEVLKEQDKENVEFMKSILEWKTDQKIDLTKEEQEWAKENIKNK